MFWRPASLMCCRNEWETWIYYWFYLFHGDCGNVFWKTKWISFCHPDRFSSENCNFSVVIQLKFMLLTFRMIILSWCFQIIISWMYMEFSKSQARAFEVEILIYKLIVEKKTEPCERLALRTELLNWRVINRAHRISWWHSKFHFSLSRPIKTTCDVYVGIARMPFPFLEPMFQLPFTELCNHRILSYFRMQLIGWCISIQKILYSY